MEHKDIDYPLLFLVLFLVLFGSIMISSVSVYDSYRITKRLVETGSIAEPNNWRFILRNILQAGIGLFAMVAAIKMPYLWWRKNVKVISVIVIALLLLVLIFGIKINGARGWFDIPGIPFSLQPTEFLKLSIILSAAAFCTKYKNFLGSTTEGFIPFLGIIGLPCFLVLLQPDLGALLIIVPIALSIYFIAGGNIRVILMLGAVALIGASLLYALGKYDNPSDRGQFSYIYDRVNTFFQSNRTAIEDNTMHHQNKQALIAIGSGGFFGLGFGDSVQKYGYLPEPQGDFIFSVITEELGFVGAFIIISIYLAIIYRGFIIASFCEENFGKFVAFGITVWIFWQMIVNISVNLSIFPNTGLTLPFVSYGGSSLLMMLLATGILLSISRTVPADKKNIRTMIQHYLLRKPRR
ncbi:FtsW/RodA/SpoVE family cell cycle protein [Candidatus Gracilibacteria bacterium]|nr:FtsW/RodA/SpoVE family cell cycle protein [Candidatus Gracilibacteria bacterium]